MILYGIYLYTTVSHTTYMLHFSCRSELVGDQKQATQLEDGTATGSRMVGRGGYATRVKALLPVNAADCGHLLRRWWSGSLGALPPSLWSKNHCSKESQVGVMRSSLYERDISIACAAL